VSLGPAPLLLVLLAVVALLAVPGPARRAWTRRHAPPAEGGDGPPQ
jgi:hypothetical protein